MSAAVQGRWRGVIAAPIAFVAQESLCYFVAAQSCQSSNRTMAPVGPTGARVLVAIISLIALAIALWGAWSGYNAYRGDFAEAEGYARPDFVALASVAVGGLLAIGIVYGAIPLVLVDVCEKMR